MGYVKAENDETGSIVCRVPQYDTDGDGNEELVGHEAVRVEFSENNLAQVTAEVEEHLVNSDRFGVVAHTPDESEGEN